jgi:FkbM family methyltransferase
MKFENSPKWIFKLICQDVHAKSFFKWIITDTKDLLYNFELNDKSTVLDLGGYKGDWAFEILKRYNCNIVIFEPVTKFYENIQKRFENIDKIKVFNFGVSGANKHCSISVDEDSSSLYQITTHSQIIPVKDITNLINGEIDLLKINTEGSEYDTLSRLIESKKIHLCKNILVQFHSFVDGYEQKYNQIKKELSKTHHLTFSYPLLWENWRLN